MQRVSHVQTILSVHPDFLGLYKSINVLSSSTKLRKLDFEQSEAAFRRPWHRNEQLKGTSKGRGHKDAFFFFFFARLTHFLPISQHEST